VHIVGRCKSKGLAAKDELVEFARANAHGPCLKAHTDWQSLVHFHAVDVGGVEGNESAIARLLASPAFRDDMCTHPVKYAVNSAGVSGFIGATHSLTPALLLNDNDNAYRTNLLGNLWSISAEWAYFREVAATCETTREFSIVALSSYNGIRACPTCAVYGSTKFGINGLVQSTAVEAKTDTKVKGTAGEDLTMTLRVNSVCPGLVATPLTFNQARGDIGLQGYQCCDGAFRDASVAECGMALKNGSATRVSSTLLCRDASECACPNVAQGDPAIASVFPEDMLAAIMDPSEIATAVVTLSDNQRSAGVTAAVVSVDRGDAAGTG